LTDALRRVDIFAPNQSEACQLTGEGDPARAAASLAEFCPLVIVKAGNEGAYAHAGSKAGTLRRWKWKWWIPQGQAIRSTPASWPLICGGLSS